MLIVARKQCVVDVGRATSPFWVVLRRHKLDALYQTAVFFLFIPNMLDWCSRA